MSVTSLATAANTVWKICEGYGVDPRPLFLAEKLDPANLQVPRARYDRRRLDAVWAAAAQHIEDPCFGLKAAEAWHPSYFHGFGFAWLASPTIRSGLERLVRYSLVLHDSVRIHVEEDGATLTLVLDSLGVDHEVPHGVVDAFWATLLAMIRFSAGSQTAPLSLTLWRPKPSCSESFYRLFRCPIEFGTVASAMTLNIAEAERELSSYNPELERLNDRLIVDYLAVLDREQSVSKVRATLMKLLPEGGISQESVASALHISPRTLQRRLAGEGMTFSEVLEEVRRTLATRYIQEGRFSISEISFLLGFSEPSNFSRAFKRWTGRAPSHFQITAG